MNINMEKIIKQLLEEKVRVHINYSFFCILQVMLNQSVIVLNGSTLSPSHSFFKGFERAAVLRPYVGKSPHSTV